MAAIESKELQIKPELMDGNLGSSIRTIGGLASAAMQIFEAGKTEPAPRQKALGCILELLEQNADTASRSWKELQQVKPVAKPIPLKVAEPTARVTALPGTKLKTPDRQGAFDQVWSEYLAARAGAVQPDKTDEETTATSKSLNAVIWKVIKTPAADGHQVSCKLELLGELNGVSWPDRRDLALISSIRSDVERIG